MANTQAAETGPAKKLLCLDGGGVRGISSLLILQAIMNEVEVIEDGPTGIANQAKAGIVTASKQPRSERKPVEYFDLTGGTSTGGIIAVMTGRLGLTCTESINLYKDVASEIFAIRAFGINISKTPVLKHLGPLILKVKLLFGSQFSAKYLNQSIDKIMKQYYPNTDPRAPDGEPLLVAPRYNPHDAPGKMLMCATMADRGKALLFRDYTPPPDAIPETGAQHEPAPPYDHPTNDPNDKVRRCLYNFRYNNVTIKEAVRATSAAPTYLPPEYIQGIQFWDGGILNNNPIDQVWAARYDLTPSITVEPYVSTVLSIGTTYPDPRLTKPKKPMGIISRLAGILGTTLAFTTNVEAKHLDFKRNIYRRNLRNPDQPTSYFRFNASTGAETVDLADFNKMPFLEKKTREYLAQEETKAKVRECAELLAKRRWTPTVQ